jgi:hypothetical protein
MLRKFVLASIAAASLGLTLAGASTPARADHWRGPEHGYSHGYDRPHGPPPWARAWGWRRHHHDGGWADRRWERDRFYDRPGPRRSSW